MAREEVHRLDGRFMAASAWGLRAELFAAARETALIEHAMNFQSLMEREVGHPRDDRRTAIVREVRRWGTYTHTAEELERGCWLAWTWRKPKLPCSPIWKKIHA